MNFAAINGRNAINGNAALVASLLRVVLVAAESRIVEVPIAEDRTVVLQAEARAAAAVEEPPRIHVVAAEDRVVLVPADPYE